MKKILWIDLATGFGGQEKFVVEISKIFARDHSFEIYVLTLNETLYLNLRNSINCFFYQDKFSILKTIKRINLITNKVNPDCIFFNGNRSVFFLPFVLHKRKIAYLHSNKYFIPNILKRTISLLLLNFSYIFARKVIHVSKLSSNDVFWFNRYKLDIIYNGVDVNLYRPSLILESNAKLIVAFIGRLTIEKGIYESVKAFETINNSKLNIEFHIIGDGPEKDRINKYIYSNKISNIKLLGFTNNVAEALKNASILILPSYFESFPLIILEAMSSGVPVIASNVGGVPEIIENMQNGILIEPRNIDQLIDALTFLTNSNAERIRIGNKGKETVEKDFTIERTVLEITNLI